MQILNLINKEKSDIDYSISRFPDGEVQITLGEFSHKESIVVKCRITNAEELFILTQVMDILDRHDVLYTVEVYYLMSMRMDRVMDFNRPFTLKVVSDILSKAKGRVYILEAHSMASLYLLDATELSYTGVLNARSKVIEGKTLVFPDKGALDRYDYLGSKPVICEKVRDTVTGKLKSFTITNPENITDDLLILDDLCDGGGTFCGIASEIRKIRPDVKLSIFVTHMVNPRGIENLSKTFDHVWFTNSYKDWKKDWEGQPTPFPKNVTQIDIV